MGKASSTAWLIFYLSLAALAACISVLIWQSITIHHLNQEAVTMRLDIQFALEAARTGGPVTNLALDERLELMQLRYEVRDLRERQAVSPSQNPKSRLRAAVNDLLRPSRPSGPFHLRPEWQEPGLQTLATNQYAQAMRDLASTTNDYAHLLALDRAAKMSFVVGRTDDARQFAEDLLALNEGQARGDSRNSNGDAVHHANIILGHLALEEGRVEEAKRRLLAAGQTPGSPVLDSFGPNMSLARDLLAKGGQDTVLQYFALCRKFWEMGGDRLDQWSKDVEAGRVPDFGQNLLQ